MESFLAHVLEPPSSDAVSAAVSEGCGKEWGGEGRGGEGRGGEGGGVEEGVGRGACAGAALKRRCLSSSEWGG